MLASKAKVPFIKENLGWNNQGPHIPLWFRAKLKQIDKDIVVQFIPPRSEKNPRGCNPASHPNGVWDVCKRLAGSHWLHPRAVFSLVDLHGQFSMPTPKTLRLIRSCWYAHRNNDMARIERVMEDSLRMFNRARAEKSRDRMREALSRFASNAFSRQWQNRVSLNQSEKEQSIEQLYNKATA